MPDEGLAVFVYGTLMSGRVRAGLLQGLRRLPARVTGRLYDLPAGYPALVLAGEHDVFGELVESPGARRLALLDDYEGVADGLYRREIVQVRSALGTTPAWAWVMTDPHALGGVLIQSGRWRPGRRR